MGFGSASRLHFLFWLLVICSPVKFLNLYICDLNTFFYVYFNNIKKCLSAKTQKYENNTILKPQLQFWNTGNMVISLFSFISFFFAKFSLILLFTHVYTHL